MKTSKLTIKEIPQNDRPRERLLKYGPEVLSDAELLAIILRSGTKEHNAISLAQNLLSSNKGLRFLCVSSISELSNINGIGNAKAAIIKAAIELGKRLKGIRSSGEMKINSPKDAAEILIDDMRYLDKEHFRAIFLNTKNIVIDVVDISIGTLNSSMVHPRELFKEAIRKNACSIIVCHNHPSGDTTPSKEDISITKRLFEAGNLIGITVLDHLIIGDGDYISLKEKMLI